VLHVVKALPSGDARRLAEQVEPSLPIGVAQRPVVGLVREDEADVVVKLPNPAGGVEAAGFEHGAWGEGSDVQLEERFDGEYFARQLVRGAAARKAVHRGGRVERQPLLLPLT